MKVFRFLKILFLVVVAAALVLLFFANNAPVTVRLLPEELAVFLGFANEFTLSLFFVVVGALIVGIIVGFIWEYLRETAHRREATTQRREAQRLNQELAEIKGRDTGGKSEADDVLALLDEAGAAR